MKERDYNLKIEQRLSYASLLSLAKLRSFEGCRAIISLFESAPRPADNIADNNTLVVNTGHR